MLGDSSSGNENKKNPIEIRLHTIHNSCIIKIEYGVSARNNPHTRVAFNRIVAWQSDGPFSYAF